MLPASRWVTVVAAGVTLLGVGCVLLGVRSYRAHDRLFFPSRQSRAERQSTTGSQMGRPVTLESAQGRRLAALYQPSQNGALVVLCHGSGGRKEDLWREASWLSAAGFGTLAFDWPGQGDSPGQVKWAEPERQALTSALSWAQAQASERGVRLGVFAASMGGYAALQVAAQDPRIAALVVAGTPSSLAAQARSTMRKWGTLSEQAALLSFTIRGLDLSSLQPEQVIRLLTPRAVMIVGSSGDNTVPVDLAKALYEAALEPKKLLILEEAGHNHYAEVGGQDYERSLNSFFAEYLLKLSPGSQSLE